METIKQPIGMPSQCEATAKAFVKAYGKDEAVRQINDNMNSINEILTLLPRHISSLKLRLNLALQSDFWSQVLQSIKH